MSFAWLAALVSLLLPAAAPAAPAVPHVVLLATGGTISGSAKGELSGEDLLALLHLSGAVQVEVHDVARVGSSALGRGDWASLVTAIRKALADPAVAGVVITHGTDTMEETAFFLDLVIDDPKPVVVTGSMRNNDALSADGPANLAEAIRVAADPQARGLGTLVVLDDQIHGAVAAAKGDTNRLSAFGSTNAGPFGLISEGQPHFFARAYRAHPRWPLSAAQIAALPRVEIVTAEFDGDDLLLKAAEAGGAKAIVIGAFGSGTVTPAVRRFAAARGTGIPLILSSRVAGGYVKQAYPDGAFLVVRSGRLNPAKARVLAMVALAAQAPLDQALFDAF